MTLLVSDLWTMNDFPGRSSSEVLTGCRTGLRHGSLDGLGVGFRGWPECRASSLGRALGLCGRLAGRCRGGPQGGVVRLYGLDLAAQLRCLLAGRCGGFAGLVAPAFVMRSALRWAFSAARLHCSTCCRRRRRKHRHHKKAGKPASRNAIIRRLLISCYGESSLETYPSR
ncbi:hypothetical protein Veis_2549 [Verminephrobacter eiseniae EF01-2]|uniref:Uncharacterized protein n=1 Tax=Verminephrobacter eiseniae (strain EF01-2) TaxID=391735 RepID=A1WKY7_VEREI|nr:hypothetical protein Veis_2549 [Verminephrobacter eiseniae EF01-2]